MSKGWVRLLPLTGVLFAVLVALSIVIGGNPPDTNASGASVISFYKDHRTAELTSAILGALGVVFFLFFNGTLRAHLADRGAPNLATTAFGGGILLAVGGAVFSALTIALADVPDKLDPAGAQVLGLLNNDFFFPAATGSAVFLVVNGVAVALRGALPRWLGWVAIVMGILAATPLGFIAFFGVLAWVLVVSVVMLIRGDSATVAPAAT